MPAGRPRKPTILKKLAGTLQKCRANAREPAPLAGLPIPPAWLPPRAAELFSEHAAVAAQMGVLSLGDGAALALLALRLDEAERTSAVLEDLGAVWRTTTRRGEIVARRRPEVSMRSEAMRQAGRSGRRRDGREGVILMEPTIGEQDARDKILAAMAQDYLATRRVPQAALEAFTTARARFEADAGLETPEDNEGERQRHRARLRLYR